MTDESLLIRQLHDEATRHAAFTQVVEAYKERLYCIGMQLYLMLLEGGA